MSKQLLRGVHVPAVTPLTADEQVDTTSLTRLVDFLLAGGVDGIWLLGTSGEFSALDPASRARAASSAVDHVRGRLPVTVNVSESGTSRARALAREAAACGADALALTPPYYFPHSDDEIRRHYELVKEAAPELPLLAYNIPSMTKVAVSEQALVSLAGSGVLAGLKDTSNDLQWFRRVATAIRDSGEAPSFGLLLGTRTLLDIASDVGATGVVPAIANVAPRASRLAFWSAHDVDPAAKTEALTEMTNFESLAGLIRDGSRNAATLATIKTVLHHWGVLDQPTVSSPLRQLTPEEAAMVRHLADDFTQTRREEPA